MAAWAFAESLDAELVHHVLMVLIGGEGYGWWDLLSLEEGRDGEARDAEGAEERAELRGGWIRHGDAPVLL